MKRKYTEASFENISQVDEQEQGTAKAEFCFSPLLDIWWKYSEEDGQFEDRSGGGWQVIISNEEFATNKRRNKELQELFYRDDQFFEKYFAGSRKLVDRLLTGDSSWPVMANILLYIKNDLIDDVFLEKYLEDNSGKEEVYFWGEKEVDDMQRAYLGVRERVLTNEVRTLIIKSLPRSQFACMVKNYKKLFPQSNSSSHQLSSGGGGGGKVEAGVQASGTKVTGGGG